MLPFVSFFNTTSGSRYILHSHWLALRARARRFSRSAIDLLREQFEPILHPSPWRIRWVGLFTMVGHPLFYWIWGSWLPQPYENPWMRAVMSVLGLLLMIRPVSNHLASKRTTRFFTLVFFVQLPVFFTWMYLCNSGNTVWLASLCAVILIYYHLTDWRIATMGNLLGGFLGWLLFQFFGPSVPPMATHQIAVNSVLIGFSWSSALLLGVSSANLRREHLRHTLSTMGIMAHELRTPLATAALIADAVQAQVRPHSDDANSRRLAKLATSLHALARNMNHQIDTQIANARLQQLPQPSELVAAGEVVTRVVAGFPYRTSRERECVQTVIHQDFRFISSHALFSQVLDNLIKNALHSLAAANSQTRPGDLRIEVGVVHGKGRITLTDNGTGIAPQLLPRIFEPFFSTDSGTGHGLGLAFCRRVVQSARGSIRVKSQPDVGAVFSIELPIAA